MGKIYNLPYKYIHLQKLAPAGTHTMNIILVYHNISKIIVKQKSPFRIECPECEMVFDNRYLHTPVRVTVGKLLAAQWEEVERG